nr:photosystem I light-harvesting complex chlorophyll a/b protein, p14 {N-terminal} [Chlamydomonas reinhardtii, Peptide Partial, 30 aa] [Chlamydomonas reinhardtii]
AAVPENVKEASEWDIYWKSKQGGAKFDAGL